MSKKQFINDLTPGNAIHPGAILKDELQSRAITQKVFADTLFLSLSYTSDLLNGKRNLMADISLKIEAYLGIDAEFLMRMQYKYEVDKIKIRLKNEISHITLQPTKKQAMIAALVG